MNFALIVDALDPVSSYYVDNNTVYDFKNNKEYFIPTIGINKDCFLTIYNYPLLFENGYLFNWHEFEYDLPDLDLDLIFLVVERTLGREEFTPWVDIQNLRKKYPNTRIVGYIKEPEAVINSYNDHNQYSLKVNFLNKCDAVVVNRPELKEFQKLADGVDKPFNFVALPHNVNYYYDNFFKDKDLAIWAYTPHSGNRRYSTLDFSKYISDKYDIPLRHKQLNLMRNFHIPIEEFIDKWSSCLFHFNLDPIPYFPGNQAVQVASTGTINVGGVNDYHHILYPEIATCDLKKLEEKFVQLLEDENKRNEVVERAWNKLNEIFSFKAVRKQIENIRYIS